MQLVYLLTEILTFFMHSLCHFWKCNMQTSAKLKYYFKENILRNYSFSLFWRHNKINVKLWGKGKSNCFYLFWLTLFMFSHSSQLVCSIPGIWTDVHSTVYLELCFNSDSISDVALWDGRAVKEHQKPQFWPRPWRSITTAWSWQPSDYPFEKMTCSSSSSHHSWAALKHRAFVWSITVDSLLFCERDN